MVCGPTASGKSFLADELAERLSASSSAILVDSMQVYREIPCITNQNRRIPAKLSGIISVTEDWSVADHRDALHREVSLSEGPFVLDAGTGMYLNASILYIPLFPKVSPDARKKAVELTAGASNPRRSARQKELELAGEEIEVVEVVERAGRGSIWDGDLLHPTKMFYIRPSIEILESSIRRRSRKIVSFGIEEAEEISSIISDGKAQVNRSVLDSIGVRELLSVLSGDLDIEQAEERINIRTRRLAKRQIRWFDKLARTLDGRASMRILEEPCEPST